MRLRTRLSDEPITCGTFFGALKGLSSKEQRRKIDEVSRVDFGKMFK